MQIPGQIQAWFDDNVGVSPVIGVILMVAITVIVAAVIGATALGMGDKVSESPPRAQLEFTEEQIMIPYYYTNVNKTFRAVTIQHTGGEDINLDKIRVTVDGEPAYGTLHPPGDFYNTDDDAPYAGGQLIEPFAAAGDTLSTGESTMLVLGTTDIEDYETHDLEFGEDEIVFDYGGGGDSIVKYYDGGHDEVVADGSNNDGPARLEQGETIRVIYGSNDQSQILAEHEIEQAR